MFCLLVDISAGKLAATYAFNLVASFSPVPASTFPSPSLHLCSDCATELLGYVNDMDCSFPDGEDIIADRVEVWAVDSFAFAHF